MHCLWIKNSAFWKRRQRAIKRRVKPNYFIIRAMFLNIDNVSEFVVEVRVVSGGLEEEWGKDPEK